MNSKQPLFVHHSEHSEAGRIAIQILATHYPNGELNYPDVPRTGTPSESLKAYIEGRILTSSYNPQGPNFRRWRAALEVLNSDVVP